MPITKLANLSLSTDDVGADQSLSDKGKDSVGAKSVKDKSTSADKKKVKEKVKEKETKTNGPEITATSQTSRFHVDTLSTLSTEIDLKQVNISVGLTDLLVDAHLRLKAGVHYALVGRNGEGKSTLLKAISDRLIPGLPENLGILLVSQTDDTASSTTSSNPTSTGLFVDEDEDAEGLSFLEEFDDDSGKGVGAKKGEITVTERVIKSDHKREKALAEQRLLLSALSATTASPTSSTPTSTSASPQGKIMHQTLLKINLSRALSALTTARKVAQRRSGARGAEARKEVLRCEGVVDEEEEEEVDEVKLSIEANELLADVQGTLDSISASTTPSLARTILLGLGFTSSQLDAPFTTLSGGWRSRCVLAGALVRGVDLLMLDEPTNYLDIMSVIWLQNYLSSVTSTLLVIAHDRAFIDSIADETIILRHKSLSYYPMNLSLTELSLRKERRGKMKQKDAMDKKRSAIERSIESGRRGARKTGDEGRMRMVKSRQKKLDERWGVETSAKGTRFKLNRDRAGWQDTRNVQLEIEELDKPIKWTFPDPEPMRFPGALISASNISFSYPLPTKSGSSAKAKAMIARGPLVLDDVSLTIHPGARVGLVGQNGEGKSTLVKLLIGSPGFPLPQKGSVERHSRLRFGYFDQHSVEILSGEEVKGRNAVEYFVEKMGAGAGGIGGGEVDEQSARAFLGSLGLKGKTAVNPIGTLSGGQKVRLALALVVYPAPDLLVLDEATTHLDKDTIVAFIRALRRYSGAVLLVSHDRHFVKCVIEGAPILPPSSDLDDDGGGDYGDDDDGEGEGSDSDSDGEEVGKVGSVYAVGPKGRVKLLPGGVDDYVKVVEKRMRKLGLVPKG
ncbi:P-loop containing nucleoside triphosphate hydrolase protein [Rickenella mellea]|uniref:P-loop containing nucleoside triphosphate hydrolase protein n=1 Tax=Rickenella mellea TaxID=50990 RepID=A0A4Y7PUP1_9AGAM|nr:P-loop containing nucleoside triphosphate hydrolase protein [Rickenella mellea]